MLITYKKLMCDYLFVYPFLTTMLTASTFFPGINDIMILILCVPDVRHAMFTLKTEPKRTFLNGYLLYQYLCNVTMTVRDKGEILF